MAKSEEVKHYLAVSPEERLFANRLKIFNETFKGEVLDIPIRFPKKLGAEHPFDFAAAEKIYQNIGVVNALVDKIADAIVGDFTVFARDKKDKEDQNAQVIIDAFIDDSNFKAKLRPWIKEAIGKGNGFMELDLLETEKNLRVMNANHMYVRRTSKGKVLGYNQLITDIKSFISGKKESIPFKPNKIAHLQINKIANDPYGIGLVWSNRVSIEHYAGAELDGHKLQARKAGMPIHVKLGQPGESIQQSDIDDFKSKLQFMNSSTEWVTDGNVQMELIDFNGVTDNSMKSSQHALEQMAIGFKVPMSMLGMANIPEGLAKTDDRGFRRFIQSVRTLIEEVIENKIFKPLLNSNGLEVKIHFEWELPDEEEKNAKLQLLSEAMKNPFMSPELKAGIEKEYAIILDLEEVIRVLPSPEEAAEQEEIRRKEEEELKQPEAPGAKPTANSKAKPNLKDEQRTTKKVLTEAQLADMPVSEYVNITELAGFNYSDYLVKILQNLRTFKFEELLAITEQDIKLGLLPSKDINKLRIVLKNGFRKNKTIRQIEKDISNSIDLKDRKILVDGELKLSRKANTRAIAMARTETVRLANQGLKDLYIENKISTYRYLAALDERTSDICNSLNGQIFKTEDAEPGVNMPPMHGMCRSTIVGLVL